MSVFKPTYTDKRSGQQKPTKKWYIRYVEESGKEHKIPAYSDKTASAELDRNIHRLASFTGSGAEPDPTLSRWLESVTPKLRDRLVKIGLVDARRQAMSKPLAFHLLGFWHNLTAKSNTRQHAKQTTRRIIRVMRGCKFMLWSDIDAEKVHQFLANERATKKRFSPKTSNYYLQATKQFCQWMVHAGRASESPLARLRPINADVGLRRVRRALTPDEVRRLLDAASQGPERHGMEGPERAVLYRLAIETGLRAGELRSLTRSSFNLSSSEPAVTVAAAYSKHRREDVVPLRPEMAAVMQTHLRAKTPAAEAFNMPKQHHGIEAFKADLKAAGIPYRLDGKVADFHALRHTTGSWLAAAGVHPKVIQRIMRHSTITLTMDRYTHPFKGDESAAIASLPDLSKPHDAEAGKATGTADATPDPDPACRQLVGEMSQHDLTRPHMSQRQDTPDRRNDRSKVSIRSGDTGLAGEKRRKGRGGIRTHDCLRKRICNPPP